MLSPNDICPKCKTNELKSYDRYGECEACYTDKFAGGWSGDNVPLRVARRTRHPRIKKSK